MKPTKLFATINRSRAGILSLVLALATLNITVPAVAHEGMEHITGTVTSIADNTLTVKTTKGKTVEVSVDAKTEYARGKAAAKMADLKEGDRVVVHAMEMNGSMVAHEVNIGANAKTATATAKATKK